MRILFVCFLLGFSFHLTAQPIALHPENPHYLIYQGNPTVLVTSAEHYGAVLNTAFDYETYLRTLQQEGMNYTRIFTGSYVRKTRGMDQTQSSCRGIPVPIPFT